MKAFLDNIEKLTKNNTYFRNVIYTASNLQIVLMILKPGEEIGEEVHRKVDQFFRIESGSGKVLIGNSYYKIKDGDAILIPQGTRHNVINTGNVPLKLYTIYSPPQHRQGLVEK